jgi:hypothetical protein
MEQKFVKLTYDILLNEDLTSTDKIILAYNLGHKTYYASNKHAAKTLGMTPSMIKKSILKLRKLGLWRERASLASSQSKDTRVTEKATRVAETATPVADKKLLFPLKNDSRLESRLENQKKDGLESAAGAAEVDILPDTLVKTKKGPESSDPFSKISERSSSLPGKEIDLMVGQQGSRKWTVPLGADGRPMTKQAMSEANFIAKHKGRPPVFTESQIGAGRDRDQQDADLEVAGCQSFFG